MRKQLLLTVLLLAVALCASHACADTVTGLTYDRFREVYAENLDFINDNASRHLLPLIPAKRDAGWGDGREYHEILGDVLSLVIRTEPICEIIESCQITLTAPQDMAYGNAVHRDFTTSGYQSYAMLMAMDTRETAYERYQLVEEVEAGIANGGVYRRQVGVYQLEASSQNGMVTMLFTNSTALPTPSPVPTETPVPEATEPPAPEQES